MARPVSPTLILESDGEGLRGTVASREAAGLVTVHATARSNLKDADHALGEVLDRLRAEARVPRRCLVLTSDVTLALLPLPLAAGKARSFGQMSHLVRWELEPYFARNVHPADVADAEAYACGWRAADGGVAGGRPLWWASGIARPRRAAWVARLRAQGLTAAGLLPRVGAAGAIAPEGGDVVVLEAGSDRVAATAWRGGAPQAFDEVHVDGDLVRACREAMGTVGTAAVVVTGHAIDETLARALGAGVVWRPELGLAGALEVVATGCGPAPIPSRDPRPPLVRRPAFWGAAALALLAAVIGFTEHGLRRTLASVRTDLATTHADAQRLEDTVAAERARVEEIKRLEREIADARAQQALLRSRLGRFASELADRRAFLPGLLQALAEAITEDVVLRRLAEVRPGAVRVDGWALTEQAVQLFTRELAESVRTLALRVSGHEMRAGDGPYRQSGFAFAFELVPLRTSEEAVE